MVNLTNLMLFVKWVKIWVQIGICWYIWDYSFVMFKTQFSALE